MKVEVIYALPNEQKSFFVESKQPMTVRQVIDQSKIVHKYPELENLEELKIGIYSEIVDLDHPVKDKDRVEIYRSLTIDPKQARMLRAEQKRKREGIRGFGA
ncbi:RnfH family protein [Francisella sp. 19X1-34]|uniref:RnfH family protein n=1 Tax=Francisella sp. 19X1-34 TaxID=3087177 RepID=UPI002E36C920|nr:RnfH family protein [Francisella sp. 19X1-34]MED7789581.1 RnfH family protein [Francisella sp. 19X1-34]